MLRVLLVLFVSVMLFMDSKNIVAPLLFILCYSSITLYFANLDKQNRISYTKLYIEGLCNKVL